MRELHKVDGAAAHRARLCISLPFSNSCKRGLFGIIVSIYQCVPVGLSVCVFVGNIYESHHQIHIVKCEMNAFFSTQVHNLFTQSILVRFVWKLEMAKCRLPNAEQKMKWNFCMEQQRWRDSWNRNALLIIKRFMIVFTHSRSILCMHCSFYWLLFCLPIWFFFFLPLLVRSFILWQAESCFALLAVFFLFILILWLLYNYCVQQNIISNGSQCKG